MSNIKLADVNENELLRELKCPRCGKNQVTMIYGLKEQHCGGDKWCISCGRIFDALCTKEKIVQALEENDT
jgi:transcription elongation factor Elf1